MTSKILKSLDLSSVTIMGTAIEVIFSIILAIILLIVSGVTSNTALGVVGLLIPALILGTMIHSIYKIFFESFLYNLLAKRMNPISFNFVDDHELDKISTTNTALIIAIISTIMAIIAYLILIGVLPFVAGSFMQILFMSGQMELANALYMGLNAFTNLGTAFTLIIGAFIVSFVYVLIGTYVFNLIGSKKQTLKFELGEENGLTTLEKLDIKSFSIIFAAISLVFGLISGIINAATTGQYLNIAISPISSFIVTFIITAIGIALYNALAPRIGKIKFELVEESTETAEE